MLLHNTMALERGDFLAAGKLIGLSLIHGGPGPHFFSQSIANYLLGMDAKDLNVDLDELADVGTLELVKKVCYDCITYSSRTACKQIHIAESTTTECRTFRPFFSVKFVHS